MNGSIGLVFGGGGGKGAYQIGVWQALQEAKLEVHIGAVAGTSVGALNGALFCMGDLPRAKQIWSTIAPGQILTPQTGEIRSTPLKKYGEDGWFSDEGLRRLIDTAVRPLLLCRQPRPFYVTASRLSSHPLFYDYVKAHSEKNLFYSIASALAIRLFRFQTTPVYFQVHCQPPGRIPQILLASSAIPLVFPEVVIDGNAYIDGGIEDNVPVLPLYRAGMRKFVVVTMDARPRIPRFPNAQIVQVNLAEKGALQSLEGTFDFTPESAVRHMEAGYRDTVARLEEIRALAQ